MALVLDATVGGASSNSYLTTDRAQALAGEMPHMGEWISNVEVSKEQYLVYATRLIDRYGYYKGSRTNSSQALAFPRTGLYEFPEGNAISSSVIPSFVEWACIEWAFHLLKNPQSDANFGEGLDFIRTPSFALSLNGQTPSQTRIPPIVADLLRPHAQRIGLMKARVLRT